MKRKRKTSRGEGMMKRQRGQVEGCERVVSRWITMKRLLKTKRKREAKEGGMKENE